MEAARIARLRGHRVSLWERDPVLGGKLDVASRAPSKGEVLRFRDYQARVLRDIGVELHTGAEVTAEVVSNEDPDVVVLANGAGPAYPAIPGIDGDHVLDAQEILAGRVEVGPNEHVTIVGGSATGCETDELLLGRVAHVAIFEMLGSIGQGIEQITRRHLIRTLRNGGVEIRTRCRVIAIEAGYVVYETAEGAVEERLSDRVALAVGWRARGPELASELGEREVVIVGDAEHPADFVAAVGAGAEAALAI
jgi:2,4-dienoyl-CoA reductase (NADPH2)